jgi:hypothetical protein
VAATKKKARRRRRPSRAETQRRAILSWMREDLDRALTYVAGVAWESATRGGVAEHAPLAEVLAELAERRERAARVGTPEA